MAVEFTNQAFFNGKDGAIDVIHPSNIYLVTMVDVNVEKSAEPERWGSGPLTYTIVIENNDTNPITGVTFKDTLNVAYTELIENTVLVDGEKITVYNYDKDTGLLSFSMKDIPKGGEVTVTFQVSKK